MPSIKLSVTVRSSLERKYDSASLKLLDRAVTDWIAHEEKPGQTEMTRMNKHLPYLNSIVFRFRVISAVCRRELLHYWKICGQTGQRFVARRAVCRREEHVIV